jgi:hypothetical protein
MSPPRITARDFDGYHKARCSGTTSSFEDGSDDEGDDLSYLSSDDADCLADSGLA